MSASWARAGVVLFGMLAWLSTPVSAQSSLAALFTAREGLSPVGVTVAADGSLYAPLKSGGPRKLGTLIRRTPAGVVQILHAFEGPDGAEPAASLIVGADGAFYGTTSTHGEHGYGTAFRLTADGDFSTLHHFTLEDGGASKVPLLLAADGSLMGITSGVYSIGCSRFSGCEFRLKSLGRIFRLNADGTLTVLYEGLIAPGGGLMQASNGDFYGVKPRLPSAINLPEQLRVGTVYRLSRAGALTFGPTWSDDYFSPRGELVESPEGFLYLMGSYESYDFGEPPAFEGVFRMTMTPEPADAQIEKISNQNMLPGGLVLGSDGNYYGGGMSRMTPAGEVTPVGGCASTPLRADGADGFFTTCGDQLVHLTRAGVQSDLHRFAYMDGARLTSALLARDGTLYGTTLRGGQYGNGTLLHLDSCSELTVLYQFPTLHKLPNNTGFTTPLVEAANGTIYAVTDEDVPRLVQVDAGKKDLTTLYSFAPPGSGGFQVAHALAVGADGALYGTMTLPLPSGAQARKRELYRFELATGARQVIATFDATSPLLRAANGDLYGISTVSAGPQAGQVMFRIRAGELTQLHRFAADANGHRPGSNLSEGPDGSIYGFARGGSAASDIIYRWTSADQLEVHYTFATSALGNRSDLAIEVGQLGEVYLMPATVYWPQPELRAVTVLLPNRTLRTLSQQSEWNVKGPDGHVYSVVRLERDGYPGFAIESIALP